MSAGETVAVVEPGRVPPRRVLACAIATALAAFVGPLALATIGEPWLAAAFGQNAPSHALAAGLLGAVLAGVTVGTVLGCLRASEPVFLSAWVGLSLGRLVGLAAIALAPLPGGGLGAALGYAAAVVLGSLIEVPAVWAGAQPAAVRA